MTSSPVAMDENNDSAQQQPQESDKKEMLLLPAGKSDGDNSESTTTTQIQLDGEAVPMRDLGPIIINNDGTTRRITNWHDLTPIEQESSWKVIAARNKRRIAALKRKQEEEQSQQQQLQEGVRDDVNVTNEKDTPDAPQDVG